jgi:mono/diheme cytochrome c family protein
MRRVGRMGGGALSAACLTLVLGGCAMWPGPVIQTGTPVPYTHGHLINLEQGWTEAEQQWFWFASQGSQLLPYDWYLALEQPEASTQELFRSAAHMERVRYLVEEPSPGNPDGLPVGFAKSTDRKTGRSYVGFTCAACHTNQLNYKGTGIRIDGAPTLADNFRFSDELVAALQATVAEDAKFERFAAKVLGAGHDAASAQRLREEVRATTQALADRQNANRPGHPYGFARLDAFGAILNQVMGADLDLSQNYQQADAPVSYPFIWDTPQSDLVQWNGAAPNAGGAMLARDVGEALGVYANVSVTHNDDPFKGYQSSTDVVALGKIEKTLEGLWSPQWPAHVLPPIDTVKAAQGQAIYQQQCASCHAVIDRTSPRRRITAVMISVDQAGTDPTMATNFVMRAGYTGRLQGAKVTDLLSPTFGLEASGVDILTNVVVGTILGQKPAAALAGAEEFIPVKRARTFPPRSYKARPLDGIWATAPYLHNGSVPNLWELLQKPESRVKQFYVGSREFDPVNVGYDTKPPSDGGYKFDTTLPGDSNAGHAWGTQLSDDQKWALIEYMKTL